MTSWETQNVGFSLSNNQVGWEWPHHRGRQPSSCQRSASLPLHPLLFNYRLDLIKSFCDISYWLLLTSIKTWASTRRGEQRVLLAFFKRRKCRLHLLAWHNYVNLSYAVFVVSSPLRTENSWQSLLTMSSSTTLMYDWKPRSNSWFFITSIRFPFQELLEAYCSILKAGRLNSIFPGLLHYFGQESAVTAPIRDSF